VYPSSSYYSDNSQAEPLVRRSVASSSLWKTWFYNEGVRVRFTVDNVSVEWAFHRHFDFPLSVYFHLSWARAIHLSPSHLMKNHFNAFPSTHRSSKWSLSFVSHHQSPHTHLSRLTYVPHATPISFSQLDHPKNICWEVQILKNLIVYSSPLPYYLASLRTRTGGRNCKCGHELQFHKMRGISLRAEELSAAQEEQYSMESVSFHQRYRLLFDHLQ